MKKIQKPMIRIRGAQVKRALAQAGVCAEQLRFPARGHHCAKREELSLLLQHLLGEREHDVQQAVEIILTLLGS